jgi:protein-S-isoprenylcysteine O-methyltransferase Ste14
MASFAHFTQKFRIAVSRIFGAMIVFFVLFSAPSWSACCLVTMAADFLAFVLILMATFGRLWALAYISGHKTKDLITEGPYSIMRNPLYLFSLIGAFGIGIVSKNILVLALVIIMFGLYYPFVIRGEEEHLRKVHGKAFEEYRKNTPMFIPKPSIYHDPPLYTIDTRLFRRAFFSVMWFPLIYMVMIIIERLHGLGIIPVLFTVP